MKKEVDLDYLIRFVSEKISKITGVKLGAKQYTLVKSRLNKRLRELGDKSPSDYLCYLMAHENLEITALVSLLTTHHSYFFREYPHFEFLAKKGLDEICKEVRKAGRTKIRVWSAACSRGQEAYSLSMFLSYHLSLLDSTMEFEVVGSDVSEECINIARNGVYKWNEIKSIPSVYLGKHWTRGSGEISKYVKAKASIKSKCEFEVINLLNFRAKFSNNEKFDIVFCRNLFIYFESEQIKKITSDILEHMFPHGQLYVGLSESLQEAQLPITHIGHSIYGNKYWSQTKNIEKVPEFGQPDLQGSKNLATFGMTNDDIDKARPMLNKRTGPIKVLAVDDSPTVLKLIERMLVNKADFELVGTAVNGVEAHDIIKEQDIDVVTLDIHMPELNGVEYLEKYFNPNHPAVVVVSSVSREDATLAMKCFEAGASDYIEKPTLSNLSQIEDELCTKLLASYEMKNAKNRVTELEQSFKRTPIISNPESKIRIIFAHVGQKDSLYEMLKQFRAPQPPTIVLFEAAGNLVGSLKEEFENHTVRAEELTGVNLPELEANRIYFADSVKYFDKIFSSHMTKKASIIAMGKVSNVTKGRIVKWQQAHVIVEDLSFHSASFNIDELKFADIIVPFTSFVYESDKILSGDVDDEVA